GPIDVYTTSFKPMRHAFAGGSEKVFMKLVVCQTTQKVLGCHIVGDAAGEMIQLVGIAIKMGATKQDFDRTVAVHPTMSEELVTLRNPTRST
ncbi:MAG: NADPH-glutathione reductase, partial [Rhodobacteraceae bacterium]|nr:NADPH-glutathione reductase [Paracoccaceae bacterium]